MNGALRIWSIPAGRCIKAYLGKGASTPITFSKDDRNLLIHYSDHTNVVPIGPFTYKASWRLSQISTTDKALQLKRKYERFLREAEESYSAGNPHAALESIAEARTLPGFTHNKGALTLKQRIIREKYKPSRVSDSWETRRIERKSYSHLFQQQYLYTLPEKPVYV